MSRNIGVNFNGKRIVRPGAHSSLDVSGLGASGGTSQKTIIFVGSSTSGEPNKVHFFKNTADARQVLRGGDLLTAGELAWSPSGDGVGAGTIGFLRVESAEQATLTKGALKLTSQIYGDLANRIQAKVEEGTIPGSKRLSIYFWPDNLREVYDNIGPIFNITYEGSQPYATVTIKKDPQTKKAIRLEVKAGAEQGSATVIAGYNLGAGEYSETNKLINDLNEHPDISAKMVPVANKNIGTAELDELTDQDIKTKYTVQALAGDFIHQTRFSKLVTTEILAEGTLEENFAFEYLANGKNGTVPASWAEKFDLLYGKGAYIVVPLTGDEAIHHELSRFIDRMSGEERSEMRAFYGGHLGEGVDTTVNRAVTLNSKRATLAYPGITRTTSGGETEVLPPYFTAAMVAGRVAGVDIGEPVTLDYLNLIGVERVLTGTEIDQLLEAGVTPVEYVQQSNRKGFRIAQCITTHQDDANPALRENSIGEISDFLNMELRAKLESMFVGGKGTVSSPSIIKNTVQSFLDQKKREEWIIEYDEASVNVVLDGEVVYVDYAVMPAFGINYVLISGSFYRKTITV